MSNLKTWLYKRRGKVFEGETLQQAVDYFLKLVEDGAEVYEFPDAIIVLENYGLPGNVRGYLLFDKFTRKTVKAIQKVSDEFKGKALYAATSDARIVNLLLKFDYNLYHKEGSECFLVKRSKNHG